MKSRTTPTRAMPSLKSRAAVRPHHRPGLVFAVFAPFGTDPLLSGYPGEAVRPLEQHPMLQSLKDVAAQGVNVVALIDLVDDDTWLVEIPAWRPQQWRKFSTWKQAMNRPQSLAGFLRHAHLRFGCAHLVLALEGHGAGFLPEIDSVRITPESTSTPQTKPRSWTVSGSGSVPSNDDGTPLLGVAGYAELPVDSPEALPITLPISTWGLAKALDLARGYGVPRPAIIHFNNCFNMSLEHLHTVARYADVATGYTNYNYFTSGSTYVKVFERLRTDGPQSPLTVGRWFAEQNRIPLQNPPFHPGVGATIALKKVEDLAKLVDLLACELTRALKGNRATHFPRIQKAVFDALQFDTNADYRLEVPDQSTDLGTWTAQLLLQYPAVDDPIHKAAQKVNDALKGVKVYGDSGPSKMRPNEIWNFAHDRIAISIMLPDPKVDGTQDWRTPYYMARKAVPGKAPSIKAQIPFLAERPDGTQAPWPAFLDEYHNVTPLPEVRLLRIPPFEFPVFDAKYTPPDGGPNDPGKPDPTTGQGRQGPTGR